MREFVVTFRSGRRYTIRADRMVLIDGQYLGFVDDAGRPQSGDPLDAAVGLFERSLVATVIEKAHLLGEEKGDPVDPSYVVGGGSDVPF